MATYINILNGGNITIGSSGSSGHPETRFTLEGGTVETYDITGTLDQQWLVANGYFDENAYAWLKTITQVDIGDTVTSIGDNAFYYDCLELQSITIGDNVTSIGDNAFSGCTGLTSVTIPDSVESIGESAFSSIGGLTNVTIGDHVTSIGAGAFAACSGLTSVMIPDSVESIGPYAFTECSGLTTITVLGKTTAAAQTLLADADVPEGCTIVGELG